MKIIKKIIINGLWKKNPSIVMLLGICPLIALSDTATHALGLGLITTLILTINNTLVSLFQRWIYNAIRIPIYVVITASVVSIIQMLCHAYMFNLYKSLNIFIPLIITNCTIMARAETCASKSRAFIAIFDGLLMGIGSTFIFVILGSIREFLSYGVLFKDSIEIFGNWSKILYVRIININTPFLLAMLPSGGFISFGLLLSIKSLIDTRLKKKL